MGRRGGFTVIPMSSDKGPLGLQGVLGTRRFKKKAFDGGFFVLELTGYVGRDEDLDTNSELARRHLGYSGEHKGIMSLVTQVWLKAIMISSKTQRVNLLS